MKLAVLHGDALVDGDAPFVKESFNSSYARFVSQAQTEGIDAVIANCSNYERGDLEKCWRYVAGKWQKDGVFVPDAIFDRFEVPGGEHETNARADFSARKLIVLNQQEMDIILKDKLSSYRTLPSILPSTILYEGEDITTLRKNFSLIDDDFDLSTIVIKPRFGSKSEGIAYCTADIPLMTTECIAQPYLKPSAWRKGHGELRIVVVNGTPVCAYTRSSWNREKLFASSGKNTYVSLKDIEPIFISVFEKVDDILSKYVPRIYSVDMALGVSGNPCVFELNGRPGQVWDSYESDQMKNALQRQQDAVLVAFKSAASRREEQYCLEGAL